MNPTFEIFLGDSKTMFLKVGCGKPTADPLDLTYCSEIVVNMPNADGTITGLSLTGGQVAILQPPILGKFSVQISTTVSQALNVGVFQNLDITFTVSGQVFTVPFIQALSVFEVT